MPHFGEYRNAVATTAYNPIVIPTSTWNPADKDADVVLSESNMVAAVTAPALGAVRGTVGKAAGKFMFEVQCNDFNLLVGVGLSTAAVNNNYPGGDANGWGYYGINGTKWTNNASAGYGATFTVGDVIGVLYDSGNLRFYKNGVDQGAAFAGLVGTVYPMFGPGTTGAGTRNCRFNPGAAGFLFPVAGYSPWV